MMNIERLLRIEGYVKERGVVSMNELRDVFGISMNTLRTDIAKLVSRGSLTKVYGGVQYINPGDIPPLEEREVKNIGVKRELCKLAAEFIREGDVVYIDAGSTTVYLTDYVDPALHFTVLTNSLAVMQRASKLPNISLVIFHGEYQRETGSFVSPESYEAIRKFNIKTAVMSATSVSDAGDFTIVNSFEYEIKKEVIERSSQTIMLADSSKIGPPKLRTFAKLGQIDYFITDSDIPSQFAELCEKQNVSVLLAD